MTTAWLRDLEEKVQEASAQLSDLREQNESLRSRESELQARVTELEEKLETAPDAEQIAGWTEERDDVRQRVEKLVDHLGQLLDD